MDTAQGPDRRSHPLDDAEERDHFLRVLGAFRGYGRAMEAEARRRERHLAALPPRLRALLRPGAAAARSRGLREAVADNQAFFDRVAEAQTDPDGIGMMATLAGVPPADASSAAAPSTASLLAASPLAAAATTQRVAPSAAHFGKTRSVLHQLSRDWSEDGAAERAASYGAVMEELLRLLPITEATRNRQRVLVPGCGLGRLPFDLAALGYAAQGNEFSYFFLFAAHVLLNEAPGAGCFRVHPWVHSASNHVTDADMLRGLAVPDVATAHLLERNAGADLSMTAGDFLDIYASPAHAAAFDGVATCFFIDTAAVVLEYIELIFRTLRPGGVWVNAGPLLYHWQPPGGDEDDGGGGEGESGGDEGSAGAGSVAGGSGDGSGGGGLDPRYRRSVELSYECVRHAVLATGFVLEREEVQPPRLRAPYAADPRGMLRPCYDGVFFSARKPWGPGAGLGAGAGGVEWGGAGAAQVQAQAQELAQAGSEAEAAGAEAPR